MVLELTSPITALQSPITANQRALKTPSTPPPFPHHCNVKDKGKSHIQANFGPSDLNLSQFL